MKMKISCVDYTRSIREHNITEQEGNTKNNWSFCLTSRSELYKADKTQFWELNFRGRTNVQWGSFQGTQSCHTSKAGRASLSGEGCCCRRSRGRITVVEHLQVLPLTHAHVLSSLMLRGPGDCGKTRAEGTKQSPLPLCIALLIWKVSDLLHFGFLLPGHHQLLGILAPWTSHNW